MPRIKEVGKEDAIGDLRAMFEEQEKRYGVALNNAPIYALRPTIRKGVQALAGTSTEPHGPCGVDARNYPDLFLAQSPFVQHAQIHAEKLRWIRTVGTEVIGADNYLP
jgi:hypothetical protein